MSRRRSSITGAVRYLRGARLADVLASCSRACPCGHREDVLDAKVLETQPDRMRVFLKLQRKKVRDGRLQHGAHRDVPESRGNPGVEHSTATKIAELESPNTPRERELRLGEDHGYLWRWNSYWRYEEVAGGVIAECESVSLSRTVPSVVSYIAGPLIRSTARESMERTLGTMRTVIGQDE